MSSSSERAHDAQLVGVERGAEGFRFGGQPPDRSQLGGHQPEVVHLAEDALDGELGPPSGHLADAPRDGGACHPVDDPRALAPALVVHVPPGSGTHCVGAL